MPWETVSLVDEKRELVRLVHTGLMTMKGGLRAVRGQSKDGDKWLGRFEAKGMLGLEELSRAPKGSPQSWPSETREAVLELKRERPHWGPKKLVAALAGKGMTMPAASTAGEWLKDAGLVRRGRRKAHPSATRTGLRMPAKPNDLWCVDFRPDFNAERPHEALDMDVPANRYEPSERTLREGTSTRLTRDTSSSDACARKAASSGEARCSTFPKL